MCAWWPTAMNARMHERLVFPEIWSPCKQQQQHTESLSMTNNNNNNNKSQLEMKSSSWRALEVESKSEATTNCTNLLGQKQLRRIRTRETCGVTVISEEEHLNVDQQDCRKQESGRINSGFLKGRGESDQVERNLQEHSRLEWQSFENRDVKQGVVQVKKKKCGTKRTPDSTYSDVYKCKLGWSKDHSGGIDSGGKLLKNMPFVDKNGAEDVKFRIGALKKPKISQTKDFCVKEKIHDNGHWLNTPLCNFQMDTMNSVINSKCEDAKVEQRGGGGSQMLNILSEEERNYRNQSSSHHPPRLSCPEIETECSDSPLACSFISFRTGESRMERRPHHTSAGVNPAPDRQHGAKELQETRKPKENSTEMLGSKLINNNLHNRKASPLMMQRNGVGRIGFPSIPNLEAEKIAKAIPTTLEGQVSVVKLKEGERDASASSAGLMQLKNGSQEPHNYSSSHEADEGQAVLGTPFSLPPVSQIVSLATTIPAEECVDRNRDGVVLTCSTGNELNCCLKNSNFCKETSGSPATAETTLHKPFQAGGETNDMNAAMASDDSLKNSHSTPSLLNNEEKCAHQYSGFPVLARSHSSKNCAGEVEGDDQKVREGTPDSWHWENDGRKIVSGGNVQLLIREERSCLRRASAVEVQRNGKFESPTPALDQAIAMNLIDLSNGKSETFWDAREQLDGSPPQITPLEFPKDDSGKEHDSHQTVADKLLVESVETHMWPGWEKFSLLEGHQVKAWQQPKGDLQSNSLQSESKLSSQTGAFFSRDTRSCGKVVAEGPGTPTCYTGVATQPVGNHCSSDELHITQNGTLDSNRLHCKQLSCPQSGPLHNAAWDTRGAHVQDDICVFKLTKSSGLVVKVPYSDESSARLEVTKISEGALVSSEDKAHNAQDQKPDFRFREMETVGAHAAMDSKACGANLDHNLEMAFQGLGLSDCLMVPETNIGDLNFGSCETMLSEQDLLHTMAIEVGQWQEGRIGTDVGAKDSCCKELHADRRRRIPIALRVKNGLKNGWLMPNWTRGAAKPKSRPEEQEISTMEEQILEMGGQQNDLPKAGSQRPNPDTMNSNCCNNGDEKPTPYSVFLFNQGIDDKIMTNFHFRGNVEPAEKVTDMPRPKDWAENHEGSILIVQDKPSEAPLQRPGSNKSEETSQSIYTLWGSQSSNGLPFGEANQSKVDTKTEKNRQTVSFCQGGQSSTNSADGLAVYNLRKMLESGAMTSRQRSGNREERQERSATDHCNSESIHNYSGINVKHQNDGALESLPFQSPETSHPKFSCRATQGNESCLDSSSISPGKLCDNQENHHFFHSNCEIKQSSPPEPLSFHFVHRAQLPVSQSSPFPLTEHVATKFDFPSRQFRIGNKGSHGPPAKLKARRHYAAASVSTFSKNKPVTSESRSQQDGRQNAACDLATSVVEPLLIETLHRECTQEVPGTIIDKSQQFEPISNLVSMSADGWEPSSPGVQAHACVQGGEREDLTLSSQNYSVTKSCRHHSEAGFDKTMPQREVSPGILMPQKPLINIPERNRGDAFWDGCKNGQRGWPECPTEEFPKEEEVFLEKFSRTKIDLHPNPPVHTVFDNPQHSNHLPTSSAELGAHHFWQHSCVGTGVTSSASHFSTEDASGSHHPLRHNTGGVGLVEIPSGYMQSNVPEYQQELQGKSSQTMPRPVYDPLASHNGTACQPNTYPRVHGQTAANYQHCGWEHNGCAVPVCTAHPPKTENVILSQMHPTTPVRAFKPQDPKPSCVWQDQLSTSWQGTHSACSPSHPWPYAYPPPPPPCPSCSAKSMSPMDQEPAPSIASASSGSMQQQKLLWLSDAELELIRQLRQHGVKGTVRDSNASQPEQPFIRAPMGGRSKSTTSSLSSYISSTDNSPRLEQEGRIQNLTNVPDGRHNAAACIQRRWRQYACEQGGHHIPTQKKTLFLSKSSTPDISLRQRQLHYSQLRQTAIKLQDYYFIVKRRYTTRGLTPPSYEKFARSLEKIQAATRGARVRCRLKSRRLQTIIMEIKEIRALLEQMSHETVRESSPYLVPQLCRQLQQKINQLHTALTGPETEARFVLRRGPASPLVMCTSRSPVPARKLNHLSAENMPIKNSSITSVPRTATSLKRLSECSLCSSTGDHRNPVGDIGKFHCYQAIQTASKQETESREHNGETLLKTDSKSAATEGLQEMGGKTLPLTSRQIDEQQLDRASEIQHSNFAEYPDIPKRPFLRRKSVVMPAQKLDWSKVKPVVSSRLEPELQTKLSTSKPKSNPPVSKSTKTNYGNVKSRLFSYETASSPNSSREGSRGYSSDVEIRRTHIKDRASLEANNYSPPHNHQMSRCPDLNMEPSHRMKSSRVESARSTFTSEPQNDDIKFGRSSAVRHMNTQKKPWVRYIRKSKPVVVEEKVGGLDLGRLPKIKVRCNPKENIKDPFQLTNKPQEEPSLWGHNIQSAERLKKKGSHSYRYANSKDMQQGYAAHLAARNEESVGRRDTPQQETKKAMHHNPAEMPLASKELELLFGEVMSRKHDNKFTLKVLFGTKGQEGSIIPRLHPASHIFQASFTEKNELFQVLKEGRATQCRQDCLSFISSRSDS